ncbi:hypothetical protein EJ06DRAFT_526488 [Trichodelitschia bisporula]|uniref:Uncharacterized protein n=1 Tax=Trichodelitschia bisporula TaxID=703511 RepID=A0A6G1I810_9PEZI|nr:hypothetical protein EJ06DRAFT_526488 [Trichodelitschia bisporula]
MPSSSPVRRFMASAGLHFNGPARLPTHPHDMRFFARRLGRTAGTFVPAAALFLGWPLMASAFFSRSGI